MDQARKKVRDIFSTAQSPAVLSSFGKDSMLLLALAREVRTDFTVLWFRTGFDETFAKRIIREWNLTAFSWAPAMDQYLLTNGSDRTLVQEYSFGSDRLPVLTDLAPGTACSRKIAPRTPQLFLPFDVILWGAKDCDTHWVKGNGHFKEDGFMLGNAHVHAPIRHMSDEQVRANLVELRIPYTTDDELPMCTACMTASTSEVYCPELRRNIPRAQWEADKSLTAFRQRFGLEDINGKSI